MKVLEVQPCDGFRLFLRFADGTSGEVDLSAYSDRGVFTAWKNPGVFEQVRVTPEGALEWPGELDLCPDALYLEMTGNAPEHVLPALRNLLARA